MAKVTPKYDRKCISNERQRLKAAVWSCDYCSSSIDEHHRCYRRVAKESGSRSRKCVFS